MKLIDTDHPFFRPLWIRIALFGFTLAWTGFELWNGEYIWAAIIGAFAALSFWGFFIDFDPDRHPNAKKDDA